MKYEQRIADMMRCDKCCTEITTGAMALFCPLAKECEFYTPAVDEFAAMFRLPADARPEERE